ncbi:hypothetical protein JVT61DRAFT_1538 [Boletus reticuloceps]|uniref:Uncharacterized protein n=1 Tax=Boletus reticuloceps TaxID=495285 RepID=A0A8I2YSI4_9AGAM|nr:hypothetical protein JVT61DRAFT_1538 [Boletus reticuloceps]
MRNMLGSLVLCTEVATQLLGTLNAHDSGADASLEVDDSLLASDADSEDYDLAGTPAIPTSVIPPAPTPASTPVPPDPTVAQEPTPVQSTLMPASTPIPGPPNAPTSGLSATVVAVDPTGPHHLWIPGALTVDGRRQQMYNYFLYDIPHEEETGQLYLITRGRRVGIFVSWAHTSPYVTGVSFAACLKVNSLDEGIVRMMEAIDLKEARWLA